MKTHRAVKTQTSQYSCLTGCNQALKFCHPEEFPSIPKDTMLSHSGPTSKCPLCLLAEGKVQDLGRVASVVSEQAASPGIPEAHNAIQAAGVNHSSAGFPQQLHNA